MLIDYKEQSFAKRYHLMAQTIIPRPIAWIVTRNEDGQVNIAPFSYFMGLSSNPPTMIVSIGHKSDTSPKDTLHNLRTTKKCTICMVEPKDLHKMHLSSKELDATVSEAQEFDIETQDIMDGFPPMVQDTPSAFFCELYQEIELQDSKTIPLIVEIKAQYIAQRLITDTQTLQWEYEPLARIGRSYALLGEKIQPPVME